jgi:hypothetical protein
MARLGHVSSRVAIPVPLGHLVGLDHVEDPTQLVHPVGSSDVTGAQAGDTAGLVLLGAVACLSLS